jgi:hypothetical protein
MPTSTLKRLAVALLATAALALAAGAAPASAGKFTTKCGDGVVNGSGWYNLKTIDTACRNARKLANHYVFRAGGNDDGFKGWKCSEKQLGDELFRVNCHREKRNKFQRVRFRYGS